MQIESFLIKQDLQVVLIGKTNGKGSLIDKDCKKLDLKQGRWFSYLSVLFNVSSKNKTRELVEKLFSMYEIPSTSNKVFILKKLYNAS